MKNAYPDKPILAFKAVKIEMGVLIDAIKSATVPLEVKRSAYIFIRNETGNGNSVVNGTNPGGVQSDSGQWPGNWTDSIVGTANKAENRTGNDRGFVVFDSLKSGVLFVCERLQARGLYIGGTTHKITNTAIHSCYDLGAQYYKEWVEGSATYHLTDDELNEFVSMYNQSVKIFL